MKRFFLLVWVLTSCQSVDLQKQSDMQSTVTVNSPYASLGWTDGEAADFLIDKFTFGPTKTLKQDILQQGIDQWLTRQLNPKEDRPFLRKLRKHYPTTEMSMQQIAETYPGLIVTLRAIALNNRMEGYKGLNGQINFNEMFGTTLRHVQNIDRIWFYEMKNGEPLKNPIKKLQFGNFMELMYQLAAQKLYRATYSKNQLEEKLVDFWFNHFNVSITRINDVATNVLSYEQDAIRPYVLNDFRSMLEATARHPAMLTYLDNTISNASETATTLVERTTEEMGRMSRQQPGINENYARELLELHTLGVDGGYTQKDIEEVARILTGWKTSPLLYPMPDRFQKIILNKATSNGKSFIKDGFYFDASRHDAGQKVVLGKTYPNGRGVEEGLELFDQLVIHPATAKNIAKKITTYFLSDTPSEAIIKVVEQAFIASNGDTRTVLKTMVESKEFWDKSNKKAKVKSPFEFVVSTLRNSGASMDDATVTLQWISKMGQPLYSFQPPTGYPTEQEFWINEAAIAQRIKFSYLLAQHKIKGLYIEKSNKTFANADFYVSPTFQKR